MKVFATKFLEPIQSARIAANARWTWKPARAYKLRNTTQTYTLASTSAGKDSSRDGDRSNSYALSLFIP